MQPSAQALGRKKKEDKAPKGRKKIKANSRGRPGKPRWLPSAAVAACKRSLPRRCWRMTFVTAVAAFPASFLDFICET